LSVLDGWWCEGYNNKNGWAIGPEITDGTPEFQNEVDAESLFNTLENQIIPLYYAKPDGRIPIAWIQLMRESMRSVTPVFNTHRMVKEYTERLYEPAAAGFKALSANNCKPAVELAKWKHSTRVDWPHIRIESVETSQAGRPSMFVGDKLEIIARVFLGPVKPTHVRVQAYVGESNDRTLRNPFTVDLLDVERGGNDGAYRFSGMIPASESGSYGFNVRVIPTHPHLVQDHELRLITWAS
jgi:starch phosphorylase